MARKRKPKTGEPLELLVSFANVNIGDASASVQVAIDRHSFSVEQADEILCGHRVVGTIIGRPAGNNSEQPNMPLDGMEGDITLTTSFDIKSFRVNRKKIGCGLVVNLADIDVKMFCQFAKRNGKFIIQEVKDLPKNQAVPAPAPPKNDDDEFDNDEPDEPTAAG